MRTQSALLLTALLGLALACPNEKNCAMCRQYNKANVCGKCFNSVYSRALKGCDDSSLKVDNCVEFNEVGTNKCVRCNFGFGLDVQGRCHKCAEEGCAVCNGSPDRCTSCFGGIVGRSGTCKQEILEYCRDTNCEVCDQSSDICMQCSSGFSLNALLKCEPGMEGCQIIDHYDKNQCFLCLHTHYLDATKKCLKNADFDYPFYKSFWFWIFVLVVIGCAILAQILYQKSPANRSSSVGAGTTGDGAQVNPDASQGRLIDNTRVA